MRHFVLLIIFDLLVSSSLKAQETDVLKMDHEQEQVFELTYKVIDSVELNMTLRYPANFKKSKKYPTIIFFFGGGWNGGTTKQFEPQAKYFATRGMVTVLVDYRVKSRHKTTPYEAVADAKSAVRFLRKHAKELNIDPKKIAASGGSAGGHLAAVCGNCPTLDEDGEDLTISSRANALVLFNPVFDNGPEGFCYDRMGDRWPEISPAHNIKKGAPPTIVFLGREDHLIPVSIAENYKVKMDEVDSRCDLHLYDGAGHGFFNNYKYDGKFYKLTMRETDLFLRSLKYLKGEPSI
ncbi:alpha/beta hydrolase [Labilibaculum sp. DW002]|uniref:Alpha/beta hydrolase n=1 Tax=Paralabilibaculum antarcticum TaxID=2912572 RepID=A0ABT5VUH7_9BACT|nr:alpha/beta hydrolase [Labilibaculum sp. DW002]MDE5419076.1 alpha/beta hydrolase [Labilibaculum sp. DW002]